MKALVFLFLAISTFSFAKEKKPVVILDTSLGVIELELNQEKAPKTVTNFLKYVDDGFYNGTIFHRVINNFMIQGGGFTADMKEKKTRGTITNEADNGLRNVTGSIAMARLPTPHSASAQFFINVNDNSFLDHKDTSDQGYGYAVFGRVITGMAIVEKMKTVGTGPKNGHEDVPVEPIVIKSAKRKKS